MISHDDKTLGKSRLPPTAGMIDAIACEGCCEWPTPHNESIAGIVGDNFEWTAIIAATNHDNTQSIIGDGRAIKRHAIDRGRRRPEQSSFGGVRAIQADEQRPQPPRVDHGVEQMPDAIDGGRTDGPRSQDAIQRQGRPRKEQRVARRHPPPGRQAVSHPHPMHRSRIEPGNQPRSRHRRLSHQRPRPAQLPCVGLLQPRQPRLQHRFDRCQLSRLRTIAACRPYRLANHEQGDDHRSAGNGRAESRGRPKHACRPGNTGWNPAPPDRRSILNWTRLVDMRCR